MVLKGKNAELEVHLKLLVEKIMIPEISLEKQCFQKYLTKSIWSYSSKRNCLKLDELKNRAVWDNPFGFEEDVKVYCRRILW